MSWFKTMAEFFTDFNNLISSIKLVGIIVF